MAKVGPIRMSVTGDSYPYPVQIASILWEGATTAGDTCILRERSTNNVIFPGRAVGTQTWEGVVLSQHCPGGFTLSQISSGVLWVYLEEP